MAVYLKVHNSYRKVIALCDINLIGKKFYEGNLQLDLKEDFYKGDKMEDEEVIAFLKEAAIEDATFNIVGEKSIELALKSGIIEKSENSIIKIQNIPHALSLI